MAGYVQRFFGLSLLLCVCLSAARLTRQKECWGNPVSPFLVMWRCFGGGLCRCNNFTLDCSYTKGRLTYVPRVFNGVQVLNFSRNRLEQISHDDFFHNVSATVWLIDLLNNGLTYISPGAFVRLPRLAHLLLGGNKLTYPALRPAFRVLTLDTLTVTCGDLGSLPSGLFIDSLLTNLTRLDLSWNFVQSLDLHDLQPLTSLTKLFLWRNSIYNLTTALMPALTDLAVYHNRLFDFPVTCQPGTNRSLFPSLTKLHLRFNMIASIPDPVCLPALQVLGLENNQIYNFVTDMFSWRRFPSLVVLDLSEMHSVIQQLPARTFNNSALRLLNVSHNNLDFSSDTVHSDVFCGCSGLQELILCDNDLSSVPEHKLLDLLTPMPVLMSVDLSRCQISRITPSFLGRMAGVERLALHRNFIWYVPEGAFDGLGALRVLKLDRNLITAITENTFNRVTRDRLQALYLGGNPFKCSCSVLWLRQWMRERPSLFPDYHSAWYNCSNLPLAIKRFYIDDQACLLDPSTARTLTAVCSLVILCVTGMSLLLAYRWHVRLALYQCCRDQKRHWAHTQGRPYQYDVFISYAEEDVNWVLDELLPVLEGRWGLRVCIHQRDFIPGKHIIDNISDCVEDSHKLLMVFSPHFARSEWCQFELKMCQTCVMDRDDVLVLVTLGNTSSYHMLTGAMLAVISTTTYLQWEDGHYDRTPFWARLRQALDNIFTSARKRDVHSNILQA